MKILKTAVLFGAALLSACSNDNAGEPTNPLDGFQLVSEMTNDNHVVEIYADSPLAQGYNELLVKIKDKESGTYMSDASVSWMPVMHMAAMSHSCPFSTPVEIPESPLVYKGFIVFQMAQNDSEYWTLKVNYTVNGQDYFVEEPVSVLPSNRQGINSFLGEDGNKYVVALVEPQNPAVALNDMTALIYRMESMMLYQPVSGYTLKIDPRMPGMGNHGSPNNVDLTSWGLFYRGKLSLTMSGLWRINLILEGSDGQVIKGEPVTDANPQSTLYFELEF